jgi:cell division protein FtsZ
MTINISIPDVGPNLRPQITVLGIGGSGGNAVNNMMNSNLEGVEFLIANTDAQALQISICKKKIQLGVKSTRGLGAGMRPDVGRKAAEEAIDGISELLEGSHMLFIAAGMGGGTGTGASPIIAKLAREKGILTVGVVTKPFHFEGTQRMKLAEKGLEELQQYVDTLLVIPNQNLFRIANEKTTFADAFKMADDVLYAGVRGVTDLMVQPGLINLDFSDVKTVMSEMGKAMMGTGEASGEGRSVAAAEAAIANPLIDDVSLKGAKGLIINITGGKDITLYEVDEAANRIKQEVDESANIIYGTTCDDRLEGVVRVSIVATGIDLNSAVSPKPLDSSSSLLIDNFVYQQRSSEEKRDSFTNSDAGLNSHFNSLSEENEVTEEIYENHIEESSLGDEDSSDSEDTNIDYTNEEIAANIDEEGINGENNQKIAAENEFENRDLTANLDDKDNSEIISNIEVSGSSELTEKESEQDETKTTVRKLSLFDGIEEQSSSESLTNVPKEQKKEPMFENQLEDDSITSEQEITGNALDPEKKGTDDDFNQETDEELLDIPTFLRRQAN